MTSLKELFASVLPGDLLTIPAIDGTTGEEVFLYSVVLKRHGKFIFLSCPHTEKNIQLVHEYYENPLTWDDHSKSLINNQGNTFEYSSDEIHLERGEGNDFLNFYLNTPKVAVAKHSSNEASYLSLAKDGTESFIYGIVMDLESDRFEILYRTVRFE